MGHDVADARVINITIPKLISHLLNPWKVHFLQTHKISVFKGFVAAQNLDRLIHFLRMFNVIGNSFQYDALVEV